MSLSDATWMTWRTSFPLWWLVSSTHCPDLNCLLLCFTSVSLQAVASLTPLCMFLLCLSRAEVWPFWLAMLWPFQWLTGCLALCSNCKALMCVWIWHSWSQVYKSKCHSTGLHNKQWIFSTLAFYSHQLKFYFDLFDIKIKRNKKCCFACFTACLHLQPLLLIQWNH